jgi:pyruvate carboxylase
VPYKLPDNVEEMILKLMKKMGYNSGSVDFIVDKQFNHYFLEVNPVGQFGMVSYPCNYFIEKEIAKDLM